MFGEVQVSVDEKMGIHIKPVKPAYPTERVDTWAHSLEDPTVDQSVIERRGQSGAENIGNSMHDDCIKENAKLHDKAGLDTYLVRDAGGGCCAWCAAIAGRYKYADAPDDVFKRHDHCTCTTTYECGRMRQDVWSKRTWQASDKELEQRKALSEASKPTMNTPEQAKELERQALEKNPVTKLTPEQAEAIDEQSKATQLNAEQAEALQNRILAVPNDSESALKYDFVEAKSIEKAQIYAKQFCNDGFMAKNFKGVVDFKGISLNNANAINKALTDVYNKVDLDKISGIKVVSPSSALGKKAFKDGADAVFSYDPIQHGIYVNKDVLKNEKSFAEYVKRSEDSWNTVMNNIDKLSGSQKELALVYQNAGRSLVDGNTVEGMFTHELGHHAQWTLLDAKTNNAVGSRMSEFAPKISGYANASKSEYLAESFSAYMKGERNILDPEYVRFIDSKAIDNGAESGIIREKANRPIAAITDQAIKSVPVVEVSGYSYEDSLISQQQHKDLLDYSRENNNNGECSFTFREDFSDRKEFIGTDDSVDFGSDGLNGSNLFVMHNHPRNSSYSDRDVRFLLENENIKALSIVKNNGHVEVLVKNQDFSIKKAKTELGRVFKKYVMNNTDEEIDRAITAFVKSGKGGLTWITK